MKLPVTSWPLPSSYTTSSQSACPSPCIAPPSTWPRAIVGLTTRPMSLTDEYATTRTSPVSGSTSTSQTWHAFGQVGPPATVFESRWIRCPGWRPARANRSIARSVPTTAKLPARYSMSPA
jgi:hypothetical protein